MRLRAGAAALDPPVDVALPAAGDRDLAGVDVAVHGGTGGDVRAGRNGDGCDEHRVGADEAVGADVRHMLVDAVVVGEDRARADVRALTDDGVAAVGEVRHLGAVADLGVLRLDEAADLPLRPELGARTQVGVGADGGARADDGEVALGPLDLGADLVVESATKFMAGHGTVMAGALIDGGKFDWTVKRNGELVFPSLAAPDPAYHGFVYTDAGPGALILKARVSFMRDTGSGISPFNAWATQLGLETLSLRMERHVSNAQKVAEWLEQQELVDTVNYAGLPSSPWYEVHKRVCPKGASSVLAFDIKGSTKEAWTFIDALKLHTNLANLGDVRSLVTHPGSTTHSQLTTEAKKHAGITDATIRLSVGLESVDDIIADLQRGFDAVAAL